MQGDPGAGEGHEQIDELLEAGAVQTAEDPAAQRAADEQAAQPPKGRQGDALGDQPADGADDEQVDVVDEKIALDGSQIGFLVFQNRDEIKHHRGTVDRKQAAAQSGNDAGDAGAVQRGADAHPVAEEVEPDGQQDEKDPQQPLVDGRGIGGHEEGAQAGAAQAEDDRQPELLPVDIPPAAGENDGVEGTRQDGGDGQGILHGQKEGHDGHHDDAEAEAGDRLQQRGDGRHAAQKDGFQQKDHVLSNRLHILS